MMNETYGGLFKKSLDCILLFNLWELPLQVIEAYPARNSILFFESVLRSCFWDRV